MQVDSTIAQRLASVKVLGRRHAGPLEFVLLGGRPAREGHYVLHDPEQPSLIITELGSGSVPRLRVVNPTAVTVYLPDGAALEGGLQTRVVNTDLLIEGGADLRIPVSCIERGRWHRRRRFRPGPSRHPWGDLPLPPAERRPDATPAAWAGGRPGAAQPGEFHFSGLASRELRRRKASQVCKNLRRGAGPDADQVELWHTVEQTLYETASPSETESLVDAYRQHRDDLDALRRMVTSVPGTRGLAAFHEGRLFGLDLFDRTEPYDRIAPYLLDSYGLDAIAQRRRGQGGRPANDPAPLRALLARLDSDGWTAHEAVGAGIDARFEAGGITASALLTEGGAVVHLQVFTSA